MWCILATTCPPRSANELSAKPRASGAASPIHRGRTGAGLLTAHERLRPESFAKIWNSLIDTGEAGVQILQAYVEELRALLALSGTNPRGSSRGQSGLRRNLDGTFPRMPVPAAFTGTRGVNRRECPSHILGSEKLG
jgi:hypothetical protein